MLLILTHLIFYINLCKKITNWKITTCLMSMIGRPRGWNASSAWSTESGGWSSWGDLIMHSSARSRHTYTHWPAGWARTEHCMHKQGTQTDTDLSFVSSSAEKLKSSTAAGILMAPNGVQVSTFFFFFFFWWGLLHGPQQGPDRMKEKNL